MESVDSFYKNKTAYLLREIKYLIGEKISSKRERVGGCYKNKK